ncbi:MAG: XRE family transcriptional regulator [bacterium]|nr:XRE family transcriptional regulator [Candidatus Aquidulcis frankliniae]
MSYFSTAFSSIIERNKWRQREVADMTGIRQGSISEYVNGATNPTAEQLAKILKAVSHDEKCELLEASWRDLVPSEEYSGLFLIERVGEQSRLRDEAEAWWKSAPLPSPVKSAFETLATAAAHDPDLQQAIVSLAEFIRATTKKERK